MTALCWPWLHVVTMGVHALGSKAACCVMRHLCAPLLLLRLRIACQGHDQPVDVLPIDLHVRVQQVAVAPRLEAPQQCVLPPADADPGECPGVSSREVFDMWVAYNSTPTVISAPWVCFCAGPGGVVQLPCELRAGFDHLGDGIDVALVPCTCTQLNSVSPSMATCVGVCLLLRCCGDMSLHTPAECRHDVLDMSTNTTMQHLAVAAAHTPP